MKILLWAGLMLLASPAFPPVIPNTYIQDHANVLTPDQRKALEAKVRPLKQQRDIEMALITVPSTNGMEINQYTTEIGRFYGIGSKDGEHRGLIVLLAVNDRHWFIEPSRHLETYITDGQAGTIGRAMVPYLKKGDYYGALSYAVDHLTPLALQATAQQEQHIASDQAVKTREWSLWWLLLPLGLASLSAIVVVWWRHRRVTAKRQPSRPIEVTPFYPNFSDPGPRPPAQRIVPKPVYKPPETDANDASSNNSGSDTGSSIDLSSSGFGGSSDFGGGGAGGSW